MTTESITERLVKQADTELREKIQSSINWIFEEARNASPRPGAAECEELNKALGGTGRNNHDQFPWVGEVWREFAEVAFLSLRNECRSAKISKFLADVESLKTTIENLPN